MAHLDEEQDLEGDKDDYVKIINSSLSMQAPPLSTSVDAGQLKKNLKSVMKVRENERINLISATKFKKNLLGNI